MSRYEHGRVLAVNETTLGSELVGDHAQGVSSLTVEDPVDFDEDGGWLRIADQVAEYTTYDDDTGEITLKGTLDAAAGEGDRVDLWDELRQVVTVDKIAQVELDGDDDNTDPLEAVIPLHLLDDLAEGIRGSRGESVLLEQDGDEWRIVDVLGLASQGAAGTRFEADDLHVLGPADIAAGQAVMQLTHQPIEESVDARWNRTPQEPTEFTVNYDAQTITWPLVGFEEPGDRLWVHYAYLGGIARRAFGFGGEGWRYLVVGESDAVDRSAPGFDDSSWSVGRGAFGNQVAADDTVFGTGGLGWPPPATIIGPPVDVGVWIRRDFDTIPAGATVTISVRVDGDATVYWNGANLGTRSSNGTTEVADLTATATAGRNVLAVHLADDVADPTFDFIYIDARVRW